MIINCDMGEGMANDEQLMPFIDAASIACGYHAGDEKTMRQTLQYCLAHSVRAGAHPSFPDRENFGRKEMDLSADAVYELVALQVKSLDRMMTEMGGRLFHVKPHGALYNMSARDQAIALAIAKAVKDHDPSLVLFGLRNSCSGEAAVSIGLAFMHEVFSDRRYREDGSLVPRSEPHAMIHEKETMIAQLEEMRRLDHVDTVCIHGDGAQALVFAELIHHTLKQRP